MFLPVLRMLRWRAGKDTNATSVYVGSDVVTMGLLSTRMIPGSSKTSQVWATANFFFAKETSGARRYREGLLDHRSMARSRRRKLCALSPRSSTSQYGGYCRASAR